VDGQSTAYVCRNFACRTPATEPELLRSFLENGWLDPVALLSVRGCPQARGSLISSQAPATTVYG